MSESLTLNFSDLRRTLQRTLDAAESQFGAEVTLQVDYYWHLPVNEAFDMAHEPSEFTAGQVSDDLKAVQGDRERIPEELGHDLSHLSGVLRALEFAACV